MDLPELRAALARLRAQNAAARVVTSELLATARELQTEQQRLRRERYSARSAQRARELREDRQSGA